MRTTTRRRQAHSLGAIVAVAIALTACSNSSSADPSEASPSVKPTITASVTPSPSGQATQAPTPTPSPAITPSQEPEPVPPTIDVDVVISIAESTEPKTVFLNAFVLGIAEDGGTCTYAIKKGDTELTQATASLQNVSTTACGSVTFSDDRIGPGAWNATVSYTNKAGAKVISPVTTIEVK